MNYYKQLCAELLGALENEGHAHWPGGPDGDPLIEQARAALAEPEPEGPTDEGIMELMPQQMHEDLAFAVQAMAEQAGTDSTRVKGAMRIALNRHIVDLARAVLARWGNRSAPQPVPVSERLPGPEDCDAEGRCWWLNQRANPDHDLLMPTWHFQRQGPAGTRFFRYTHWLPANALPLPEEVA